MRITIQMELKLTKTPGPLHKYMHVLNYNCMALEDYVVGPL